MSRIRDSHCCGHGYSRVSEQYLVHLRGVDLGSSDIGHILDAVFQYKVAIIIHSADVPSMQPAVVQSAAWPWPVSFHGLGSTHHYLTALACPHLLARVRIDYHSLSVGNRHTHPQRLLGDEAGDLGEAGDIYMGDGAAFGQTVALGYRHLNIGFDGIEYLSRKRGRTRQEHHWQASDFSSSHPHELGGHNIDQQRAILLHQGYGLTDIPGVGHQEVSQSQENANL